MFPEEHATRIEPLIGCLTAFAFKIVEICEPGTSVPLRVIRASSDNGEPLEAFAPSINEIIYVPVALQVNVEPPFVKDQPVVMEPVANVTGWNVPAAETVCVFVSYAKT